MVIKIVAEQTKRAHDRRAGHVDQRAEAFAAIEIDDLWKLIEQCTIAFPLLDAFEHRREHHRFHAACRTLTARFAREELRDANRFFDHARVFGIKTHHTAAETRARAL